MPILTNARHERFAQNVAMGMSAATAYEKAGYKADRKNAARLTTKDDIHKRIAELQGSTAKQITDIRDMARSYTAKSIEVQASLMEDESVAASVRLAAALALQDRGYGKSSQHIEHTNENFFDTLSYEAKQALLAALEAIADDEGDLGWDLRERLTEENRHIAHHL